MKNELRDEIRSICNSLNISSSDLRELGVNEDWQGIEDKLYGTFCNISGYAKPVWWWEHFKLETVSVSLERTSIQLRDLIPEDEMVWFFINDVKNKFWFYEGKAIAIENVIAESIYIDELYVASKKYKWLICIDHHNVLIATGEEMSGKIKMMTL